MKTSFSFVHFFLLFFFCFSCTSYNKQMSKAIKKSIGSDISSFKIFSYPTNNFGLITSYNANSEDFLCDMWKCIGVVNPPADKISWLKLNDFAALGEGGTISLSQQTRKNFSSKVILPKLYNVMAIDAQLSNQSTTSINLNIGKAYIRRLRKQPIFDYIANLDNSNQVKLAFNSGNLILVVSDCVIDDLSISIKVDNNLSAALDAKLGNNNSMNFNDGSLSFKLEKNTTGFYTFSVSHPVIYATFTRKQPSAGVLGTEDDFKDWQPVTIKKDPSNLK